LLWGDGGVAARWSCRSSIDNHGSQRLLPGRGDD